METIYTQNFRLNSSGEYLALVEPNGTTVASEIISLDASHRADVSVGQRVELSDVTALVSETSSAQVLVAEVPQEDIWREVEFQATHRLGLRLVGRGLSSRPAS